MDRKSMMVLVFIFGGLFLSLFGFLFLAYVAVKGAGDEDGSTGFVGSAQIGVIELTGVIENTDKLLKQLRKLEKADNIKAILVRIDSPGGAVAPSQEIYSELRKLQEKKKVVCSMGNLAASGGYYIAAGCQKIVANAGTLTGSIGVISQIPNVKELSEWAKVKFVTVKAGKLKDLGNMHRDMTDEELAFFQGLLDHVHGQFIKAVAEGRGLKEEEVRPHADGRILTGLQAKDAKLVDEIGNFNDAVKLAAAMADVKGEPKLYYPEEEREFGLQGFMKEGGRAFFRGAKEELVSGGVPTGGFAGPMFLMQTPAIPVVR